MSTKEKKYNPDILFEEGKHEELYLEVKRLGYKVLQPYGIPIEEKESLIGIAFAKSVKGFQPDKGFNFITYFSRSVINEAFMQFRKLKKTEGIDIVSLDFEISNGKDNGTSALQEIIPDNIDIETDCIRQFECDQLYDIINKYLSQIEKTVILGLIEGKRQRHIAKELDFSQSYISKIEKNAIKKLRGAYKALDAKEKRIMNAEKRGPGRPRKEPIKQTPAETPIKREVPVPIPAVAHKPNKTKEESKRMSLLERRLVGSGTGNSYKIEEDTIIIITANGEISIPKDKIDVFAEEIAEINEEFIEK